MRRDLVVRYGRDNIGFAWVVLEPMILTIGVMIIWTVIKPPFEHGVRIVALVLTGYMPLTLFRHMTNTNVAILKSASVLFYHRSITTADVLIARALIEFAGTTIALMMVYGTLLVFGQIEPIEDIRLVISAWLLVAYFAFGVGLCFAAFTELSEVSERFVQTFQYLQVPISGAFYMVDWIPTYAQDLILYTPFVHCFEMFRAGFYGSSVPTYYNPTYVLFVSTIILAIGIYSVTRARENLHVA